MKKAAVVLSSNAPANAIVGRVGGDEFIIFLPGVGSRQEGEAAALKLVRGIGAVYMKMGLERSCSVEVTHTAGNSDSFHEAYVICDSTASGIEEDTE